MVQFLIWLEGRRRSFGYAFAGLGYLVRTQPNFRIHLVAVVLVGLTAVLLDVPSAELGLLALTVGLVLAAEALNSALEAAVDAVGGPPSMAAKHAKDAAAAAVLLAAGAAIVVGWVTLGGRLSSLLGRGL